MLQKVITPFGQILPNEIRETEEYKSTPIGPPVSTHEIKKSLDSFFFIRQGAWGKYDTPELFEPFF